MLLKQKCIEFYDAASCTYDEVRFSTKSGILYDHLLKQKVYQFLKGESSILDAGAGTGRFSLYFASKGKKVISLDSSNNMLNIIKSKAKRSNLLKRIKLKQSDLESIPLKECSVDSICCINVMSHFQDRTLILKEFHRILKKEGLLVFNTQSTLASLFRKLVDRISHATFRNFNYSLKQLKRDLSTVGFVIISVERWGVIPTFVTHLLLDILHLTFLESWITSINRLNLGTHILIQAKKVT